MSGAPASAKISQFTNGTTGCSAVFISYPLQPPQRRGIVHDVLIHKPSIVRLCGRLLTVPAKEFRPRQTKLHRHVTRAQIPQRMIRLLRSPPQPSQPFPDQIRGPVRPVTLTSAVERITPPRNPLLWSARQTILIGRPAPPVSINRPIQDRPKRIQRPHTETAALILHIDHPG